MTRLRLTALIAAALAMAGCGWALWRCITAPNAAAAITRSHIGLTEVQRTQEQDLGIVSGESSFSATFLIRNHDWRSTTVQIIEKRCGCVDATAPQTLASHAEGDVTLTLEPGGREGEYQADIVVEQKSDDGEQTVRKALVLRCEIIRPLKALLQSLTISDVVPGETIRRELTVLAVDPRRIASGGRCTRTRGAAALQCTVG